MIKTECVKNEVFENYLRYHQNLHYIINSFCDDFSVTWGAKFKELNTVLHVFLLSPSESTKETFGLYREVVLIVSEYDSMEARTLQAIDIIFNKDIIKGRADNLVFFFVSNDQKMEDWLSNFYLDNSESRIMIPFTTTEIRENGNMSWFVKTKIQKRYLQRDLYNYSLPIVRDSFFFGREDSIGSIIDSIKSSENRGLFGLRKTGKTSLLFKIQRILEKEKIANFFFFDCKLNSVRSLHWFELLRKVSTEISNKLQVSLHDLNFEESRVDDSFIKLIKRVKGNQKIVLIFDEIDYISPSAIRNVHWQSEFIDFFQTLWSCQSVNRRLLFILAGVNPSIVEIPTVDNIQNPVFGIVPYDYIKGLSYPAAGSMIKTIGTKMGLRYTDEAIDYIFKRYGGHPLLTRMACSQMFNDIKNKSEEFPVNITLDFLNSNDDYWDDSIVNYCSHIVSELELFYKEEYELLELLAFKRFKEFIERTRFHKSLSHLEGYGLVEYEGSKPTITIPVVEKYIKLAQARKEKRKTIYSLIPTENRIGWLESIKQAILKDLKIFNRLIIKAGLREVYPHGSIFEGDKFINIKPCDSDEDYFGVFINIMYRCFVEPINHFGNGNGIKKYYDNDFQRDFCYLYEALERIRLYRHDAKHIRLNPNVNAKLLSVLMQDLEGNLPSETNSLYFYLQQCVLESLSNSIVLEIERVSGLN